MPMISLYMRLKRFLARPEFTENRLKALLLRIWWELCMRITKRVPTTQINEALVYLLPGCFPLYATGYSEQDVAVLILTELKSGMVFVDIGAHIGEYSIRASQVVGEQGRVYAFEPNSDCYDVLIRNVNINGFRNIVPERAALSDSCGVAQFEHRKYPDGSGLERKNKDPRIDGTNPILFTDSVRTTTLDHYVRSAGLTRVDLLKIDVEGAELKVVRGANGVLGTFFPALIFEFDTKLMGTYDFDPKEILSLLRMHDYRVCVPLFAGRQLYLDDFRFLGERDIHTNLVAFREIGAAFRTFRLER